MHSVDLGQVVTDIDMSEYATKSELAKKMDKTDKVTKAAATASSQDWPGIHIGTNSHQFSLFITPDSLVNWNATESITQWKLPCDLLNKFKFGQFSYQYSVTTKVDNVYINTLQWSVSHLSLTDEYAIFVTITSTKTGAVYSHTVQEKTKTTVKCKVTCPFASTDDIIQVYYLIVAYK